jgi:hypothetical protein
MAAAMGLKGGKYDDPGQNPPKILKRPAERTKFLYEINGNKKQLLMFCSCFIVLTGQARPVPSYVL